MAVILAASCEGQGVGAVLGGAEHMGLLAVSGDAVALQVRNVGRERRRTKGTVSVAGHPGLQDDAALGGEQTAAAECGTASPEPRVAKPGRPPPGRVPSFMTGLPGGAQHLVDKALAAATIADAAQLDIELIVVAVHACPPGGSEWPVLERNLKKRTFRLRAAREPTDAPARGQVISMAWPAAGGASFILPSCGRA